MSACTRMIIDGFSFNACWGVCSGQCIAPDCSDDYTMRAVLNRSPALLLALSKAVRDIDDIMVIMEFWHCDPEANCEIDKYRTIAQKVLRSPYASENDRARAQEALNWSPSKHPQKQRPQKTKQYGYVYVLRAPVMDPALYKIGREKVLNSRVESLGITLPWDLELVAHIESDDYIGLEAELHQKFADKRDKGEWFRLTEEDIEWIKNLESQKETVNAQ